MSPPEPSQPPRYEPADAQPRVAAAIAGSLAAMIAIGFALSIFIHLHERARSGAEAALGFGGRFQHGPEERTSIEESWADYDRSVRGHLGGYAWVDRRAGIVRIPIERAMELVAGGASPGPDESSPEPNKP
jgi:hypothetical protein